MFALLAHLPRAPNAAVLFLVERLTVAREAKNAGLPIAGKPGPRLLLQLPLLRLPLPRAMRVAPLLTAARALEEVHAGVQVAPGVGVMVALNCYVLPMQTHLLQLSYIYIEVVERMLIIRL